MSYSNSTDKNENLSSDKKNIDRTILPIQTPSRVKVTEMDARKARKPQPFSITAQADAPNIVLELIDDIGFGATSTFGGAINTRTFDKLADNGLRFNRFHTTALCSPTRESLLSGRDHHKVNVDSIMEVAIGFLEIKGFDLIMQSILLKL